jgi:hypothetical protein
MPPTKGRTRRKYQRYRRPSSPPAAGCTRARAVVRRLEDARELAQAGVGVGQVAHAKATLATSAQPDFSGKLMASPWAKVTRSPRPWALRCARASICGVKVHSEHVRAGACEGERQIARAAAGVDHQASVELARLAHGARAPRAIDPSDSTRFSRS